MITASLSPAPSARGSPFGSLRLAIAFAAAYAVLAILWLTLGEVLPGGRWFAVHLFTLGVLSNLVVALTHHFGQTLLHVPFGSRGRARRMILLNAGALLILAFPPRVRWHLAIGPALIVAAVVWLWLELRRMRQTSLQGRFAFVVLGYERALVAFLAGATPGMLMGIGALRGTWYGTARLAHLHVNVLGWGGLTLLATVVFFGPTMMRTRMAERADAVAARALPVAAGGLALGVLALLLSAADGVALAARLAAAAGFAVYAAAATVVCRDVLRAGGRAKPSVASFLIRLASVWFILVVWADAVVVGLGQWRLLDALGAGLLVGVLGQAILASLDYLTPMVWGRSPAHRAVMRSDLDVLPKVRLAVLNGGLLLVVASAVGGGTWGAVMARGGWTLVALAVLSQVALIGRSAIRGALR